MDASASNSSSLNPIDYLVHHAETHPTYWNNHAPNEVEGLIHTMEGNCESLKIKGRLTRIFQTAMCNLREKLSEGYEEGKALPFNTLGLMCRQGAGSLMHGMHLTLDLDPLDFSALRIKIGEEEYEVPTSVVRRSEYLKAMLQFSEQTTGIVDLTEELSWISEDTWKLYLSEDWSGDHWPKTHKPENNEYYAFFNQLAQILYIANYLGDTSIKAACIDRLNDFKVRLNSHESKEVQEIAISTFDILLNLTGLDDYDALMKRIMLVNSSPNILQQLQFMKEKNFDTTRIHHLYLQDHNETRNNLNYDTLMETIAGFCPQIKYLYLTFPKDMGQVSRIPEAWHTNLVELSLGHHAPDRLQVEALDHMPNLEQLKIPGKEVAPPLLKYELHFQHYYPYPRPLIGCPKLETCPPSLEEFLAQGYTILT